ncbi:uroporphyrinogen-III C-methyltransferase [Cohaesibacter celericrescens]|uniref:uroporphyrinogen-III C-methyltransferase n=1 Tax=Cohaesibacter celericrescens TaxID=2067669 RepID=A0A2N5XVW4_9HYPH|nr:uroporphyrinogen-III C-methyltransferase [Cohaesibacter celericrescens]PLW78634.1 uroporphyrinogen-III C-methyltransferase [Cohaesibacter celericrescens]
MSTIPADDTYSKTLFDGLPEFLPGWVWLVGGGPGDRGLLTLHAVNAIRQADLIVYDALVDAAILSFAKADVVVEFAGKRGGRPSPKQQDINLRLIEQAQKGKRVLRLKGGDPFIFGRGGEEALGLVAADIPFRIVPGITAGIGGLCYAGIPATHRDINQSVTFLTGHDQTGSMPTALNWDAIAKGSQVIVMYMAMKHLKSITEKLLKAGRNPKEGAAIICNATTPKQAVLVSDLDRIAEETEKSGLAPPALFVVGDVVRMREGLDWLGYVTHNKKLISDPLSFSRS